MSRRDVPRPAGPTARRLRALACAAAMAAASSALGQGESLAPLSPLTLEGDVEAGRALAYTCSGCHSIPGYRNAYPSYHVPKLGGQNVDYLEIALQGYRRGTRHHQTMRAQAASLTDQEIADLAAYFASLEGEPTAGTFAASAEQIEAGRQQSVACTPCHGRAGEAEAPQWPDLAGQHASYLAAALEQYQGGARADLFMGPMIATLGEQDIAALAAFYAALPGLYVAGP